MDGEAWEIKGRLGLQADWFERWESLSYGERKRAQIAGALWREPPVMAMDEPTNHLDLPSVERLEEAMAECSCGLLLVSEDEFSVALDCEVLACQCPDGGDAELEIVGE